MSFIVRPLAWLGRSICSFLRWYWGLFRRGGWLRRSVTVLVSLPVLLIILLGMVDINFLWLFGRSPGFMGNEGIMHPHNPVASEIYSADGQLIGRFFSENRTPVKYEDVAPVFWQALIDTEDERFYSHLGIDPIGILGAVKDAVVRREARGASTITQQLAKNIFRMRTGYSTGLLGKIPGLRIGIIKIKEWIVAAKLEMVYSKKEILTMYANTVDFGSNAFGIKTAARLYFNTTPDGLTTAQAATLVGVLKGTSLFNPLTHPDRAEQRRNQVLLNMVEHGHLSEQQYEHMKAEELAVNYTSEDNFSGKAPYFRQAVADYLQDWCRDNEIDLYTDGLKIYTTLDLRIQSYAEAAVREHMAKLQRQFDAQWGNQNPWRDEEGKEIPGFVENIARKLPVYEHLLAKYGSEDSVWVQMNTPHNVSVFDYKGGHRQIEMSTMDSIRYMSRFLHAACVAVDPATREVKAWVGDVDFRSWQYDKVKANRQPGSTFKLFAYTEAINQGLTPCDKRRDEQITLEVYDARKRKDVMWTPQNAERVFSGDSLPLRTAFARSVNSVAVRLGQEMGISNIIKCAHDMGITTELEGQPPLVLGASDVTLIDMVNAYGTIADDGMAGDYCLVTRIEDGNGRQIYQGQTDKRQAIPYATAFYMQKMLHDAITLEGATGRSLQGYVGPWMGYVDFGGKTGTSQNQSDGWFIATSPRLVVGAWVGGEYRSIHFRGGGLGQGARAALPICGEVMRKIMGDGQLKEYRARYSVRKDFYPVSGAYDCDAFPPKQEEDTDSTLLMEDEPFADEEPFEDPTI